MSGSILLKPTAKMKMKMKGKDRGMRGKNVKKSNVYIQDGVALNAASTRVRFVPVVGD
jgi:hypothetical protein